MVLLILFSLIDFRGEYYYTRAPGHIDMEHIEGDANPGYCDAGTLQTLNFDIDPATIPWAGDSGSERNRPNVAVTPSTP